MPDLDSRSDGVPYPLERVDGAGPGGRRVSFRVTNGRYQDLNFPYSCIEQWLYQAFTLRHVIRKVYSQNASTQVSGQLLFTGQQRLAGGGDVELLEILASKNGTCGESRWELDGEIVDAVGSKSLYTSAGEYRLVNVATGVYRMSIGESWPDCGGQRIKER